MELIRQALDFVLHLSDRLDGLAAEYRSGIYALLFLIVFCETGLVITPFLPGDSLLFAVGAVAAREGSAINIWVVAAVLFAAAFAGDNVNYWVGRLSGRELVRRFPRLIQQKHLDRTHAFFEKYGRKTIVLARFVPIIRTFTPFVAGMGAMDFPRFLGASILATTLWVGLILPAGWFFGNFEPVKKHFELVVIGIIVVSCIPMLVEYLKSRREARG
ncbi:MAG: VTT domain-containing protein [Verrucomicrobiota bacterium]